MKAIKKFFQLMAKHGLYRGQLFLEGTEYRFSIDKGFEQIEGQEVKIPTLKLHDQKKDTIKREPAAADEFALSLENKEKRKPEKIQLQRDLIAPEQQHIDGIRKSNERGIKTAESLSFISEKPPSERRKNLRFTIISFTVFLAVTAIIIFFGIKFISKKPSSRSDNNQEQTDTINANTDQIQKEVGEGVSNKNAEYQQFINQARDYMVAEELEKARESLSKAKAIRDDEEIKKLDIEIKTLEKLKSKTEIGKIKKVEKPETIKGIRIVSIRDLGTEVVIDYLRQLQNIRINLPKKISASGYINMKLQINEKGNISISSYNDTGLTVKPASKKGYVVELIKSGIWVIQFPPPKDKNNRLVKVGNWRLNFQVTQYRQLMILRKQ